MYCQVSTRVHNVAQALLCEFVNEAVMTINTVLEASSVVYSMSVSANILCCPCLQGLWP